MTTLASAAQSGCPHVLVVSYYFPPMGLSGVQRVSRFVKYLPEFGWEVSVLTVTPRGYFAFDDSIKSDIPHAVDIVRTGSVDPTRLFRKQQNVGLPKEQVRKTLAAVSQFAFIPDNKIGWYLPAVTAGRQIHRRKALDVVFSSAPPYTAHLVARSIAKSVNVPLVADFRDDWLNNPRHVYPTRLHRAAHRRLESGVIRSATSITTINDKISISLGNRVNDGLAKSITMIPQGFDPDDFADKPATSTNDCMTLLYSGVFYDVQTPDFFLRGLRQAFDARPEIQATVKADFAGLVPGYFANLVSDLRLDQNVNYHGYVPHSTVTGMLSSADVLWMTIGRREGADGVSTGKLYEYFGSARPILGLVPEGVARDDLLRYGAARIVHPEDVEGIARAILEFYDLWKHGTLPSGEATFIAQFDRRSLTRQLGGVLEQAIDTYGQSLSREQLR